jgi:hypothetical protein
MKIKMFFVFVAFLLALSSSAQTPQGFQQVLIPFDTATFPGGAGAIWSTELRVRNDSAQPVNLFPETCFSFGAPVPCSRRIDIPANTTQILGRRTNR